MPIGSEGSVTCQFAMHDWTTWHEVILNNVFQTKKFDPVFPVKQKVKYSRIV